MVDAPEGQEPGGLGEPAVLQTGEGEVSCLLIVGPPSEAAVVWAGSWQPGDRLSPIPSAVSRELLRHGVASLAVRYRQMWELNPCVLDTLAGVEHLQGLGYRRIAVVGHSFSGAVAISAAARAPEVTAVVALASQNAGAHPAAYLSPRPLLLVHGADDTRVDPFCSEQIYSWAKKPKELVLLEGASHSLWERKDVLLPLLGRWLAERLRPPG